MRLKNSLQPAKCSTTKFFYVQSILMSCYVEMQTSALAVYFSCDWKIYRKPKLLKPIKCDSRIEIQFTSEVSMLCLGLHRWIVYWRLVRNLNRRMASKVKEQAEILTTK